MNDEEILRYYTMDSYFFRVLNNTLKLAKEPKDFFVVGEPFNKMYSAIKSRYKTHRSEVEKVYRKAQLTTQEDTFLKNNIGSYIEILAFISTSKEENKALNFENQNNRFTIIEFDLKCPESLGNGYADLSDISEFPDESEILINAMNIFKVK